MIYQLFFRNTLCTTFVSLQPYQRSLRVRKDTIQGRNPATIRPMQHLTLPSQRLVDFLIFSCNGEEPDSSPGSDSDTPSACVLNTWSLFSTTTGVSQLARKWSRQTLDWMLATHDVPKMLTSVSSSQPWEGSFNIMLRRDCQDDDKEVWFGHSRPGDDTPWARLLGWSLVALKLFFQQRKISVVCASWRS